MKKDRFIQILSLTALILAVNARDNYAAPVIATADGLNISAEYGKIAERFDAGGDKLVIHIQDYHTNYEAQKNSAGIIEDLINKYGLSLVLVEGRLKDFSFDRYKKQYPLKIRKELAEKLLKKGTIAGEQYLDIITDYPMKLQGVEDRGLYARNMEAFLEIDNLRASALKYTGLLSEAVSNLKPRFYNKALKELDRSASGFRKGSISLNEYAEYLNRLAKAEKIDISSYPEDENLANSIDLEGSIDFVALEKEKTKVIEQLSKTGGRDELNELLTNTIDFKAGKLSQGQYHNYLKKVMAKSGMDIKGFPNLDRYDAYVTSYEKIDPTALLRELKIIEGKVQERLAETSDQREFLKISRDIELMTEFIELKLSQDDFDYYIRNEADFNTALWAGFLNDRSTKYKLTDKVPDSAQCVEQIIPSLKNFYITAGKRDEAFLDNTKKYMDNEGVNVAVLIAGGFHTPTLTRLFKQNKISYVVISPKVRRPTDEKLYHNVLTEGWVSLNE